MLLVACGNEMQPAQLAISEIDTQLEAASAEAAKYLPAELAAVRGQLGDLQLQFSKGDYAAVLSGAPAVLVKARALAAAAAARKAEVLKAQNDQWTALSTALPDDAAAIQNRLDALDRKPVKHAGPGIDLAAARARLSEDASLWSKAQAAFAAGNLTEAVSIAERLKTEYEALAASLKLALPAADGP